MTTKKLTPKQLEAEVNRLGRMEPAIWHACNQLNEVFSLLVMAREYAKTKDASLFTVCNGIDGIFTSLITIQQNLLDNAGLEE
jgi:hypothetical protein